MPDILFKPFDKQEDFIFSKKRYAGAFAGKRCISPSSKILTMDGLKSFGDVSERDHVLSFDRKANRFRISQSGCAFPKTKSTGFRVVHDRGEFVASEHHRILSSLDGYLSVGEIFYKRTLDSSEQSRTFLCHQQTTEELFQLMSTSSVLHYSETDEGFLENCGIGNHLYGRQPLPYSGTFQALFPLQACAHILGQLGGFFELTALQGVLNRSTLEYSRRDPWISQISILGEMVREAYLFGISDIFQYLSRSFLLCLHCNQESLLTRLVYNALRTRFSQSQDRIGMVQPSSTRIISIEKIQEQWFWDVEVPGDNNYICEGMIHHNSGKTEGGIVRDIRIHEQRPGWNSNGRDNLLGVIVAPTHDMLMRVTWKKFLSFARGFIKDSTSQPVKAVWHDGSEIIGISADRPERMEGIKPFWIHLDECFQMKEQVFLEAMARVADQVGYVTCTGSLGVQYINPKTHWVYKHFKEKPGPNTECFEWTTIDNPYFPKQELEQLKNTLDDESFKQMFELNWDSNSSNMVYSEFSSENMMSGYAVNDRLPIFISIDWGWRHKMACLFAQYDQATDTVYIFDEIVRSKMKLEELISEIRSRSYQISGWCCDIAGNQEREQSGLSNVRWFKDRGISMRYRATAIMYGVSLVRSYIRSSSGTSRLKIDTIRCPELIDSIKRYRYSEKDGIAAAEVPIKEDDDAVDSMRYLFVNFIDKDIRERHSKTIRL